MKVKLRKKIRKRYHIEYNEKSGKVIAYNYRTRMLLFYKSFSAFLVMYAYDHIGFMTGSNYEIRLHKRLNNRKYYNTINQTENK